MIYQWRAHQLICETVANHDIYFVINEFNNCFINNCFIFTSLSESSLIARFCVFTLISNRLQIELFIYLTDNLLDYFKLLVTLITTKRVSMGLTVNRQMAKKSTVNRQKRNIFTVNRQMSEPKLAVKFIF